MPSSQASTMLLALFLCALASCAQQDQSPPGMPSSGGYKPPALSLQTLLESDKTLSDALLSYTQTADSATFRATVESAATSGNISAQLLLAEQYIPEQCATDPDRDVPNCGPNGKHNPKVIFRTNPLELPASYEQAAQWLERASTQGSGEASEILAQLITRMLSNGHATTYTPADSTRLHALARSQGFDVEPLSVSCYQLTPAASGAEGSASLMLAGAQRRHLTIGAPPFQPVSTEDLETLHAAGATGTLHLEGETTGGDSALLSRPAGPPVHIRLILDHDPGHEIHLPIPAHHDVLYLQRGDHFIALPPDVPTLPRALSLMPQRADDQQVSVFVQNMDGGYSGTFCARF